MAEENKTENQIETTEVEEVVETAEAENPNPEEAQAETVEEGVTEEADIKEEVEVVNEPGIIEANLRKDLPEIKPGDTVKVHQILKEKNNKERIQIFEGQVLAFKHGKGI